MGIEKIRPYTSVEHSEGIDGKDAYYYIEYRCPKCKNIIFGYRSSTACSSCGTFYDWGEKEPSIVITRVVKW